MIDLVRERWAAMVIAGGALLAGWSWWAQPALEAWGDARLELAVAQSERAALANLAPVPSGGEALARSLLELRFGAGGVSGEQDHAHELARQAGVTITQVSVSAETDRVPAGPVWLVKGTMSLEAEGTFDGVVRFLDLLDAAPMATVERLEASPMGEGEGVRLEAEVRLVRLERAPRAVAEGSFE